MIVGTGIDIVEVDRIRQALERHGQRFVERIFCAEEAQYCYLGACPCEKFAARFAAKEAVMKALGVGWTAGVRFTDVCVAKTPDGAPFLRLNGRCRSISDALGVDRWHVSLSHTANCAIAQAVAERLQDATVSGRRL